jgi:tripartite-type tricarboxylate transporter receptor subunit TctC
MPRQTGFPTLPDVPTFDGAGATACAFSSRFGVFAPAPRDIIGRPNSGLVRIIREPQINKTFSGRGIEPLDETERVRQKSSYRECALERPLQEAPPPRRAKNIINI